MVYLLLDTTVHFSCGKYRFMKHKHSTFAKCKTSENVNKLLSCNLKDAKLYPLFHPQNYKTNH